MPDNDRIRHVVPDILLIRNINRRIRKRSLPRNMVRMAAASRQMRLGSRAIEHNRSKRNTARNAGCDNRNMKKIILIMLVMMILVGGNVLGAKTCKHPTDNKNNFD